MTPADLTALGEAMYGSRWKAELARSLGVNLRTVQDMARGEGGITEARQKQIRTLAHDRANAILRVCADHAPVETAAT